MTWRLQEPIELGGSYEAKYSGSVAGEDEYKFRGVGSRQRSTSPLIVDAQKHLIETFDEYAHTTRTVAALERAEDMGRGLHPGQNVEYVVVDDTKRSRDRVRLLDEADRYDVEFYCDQLIRAAESVLAPLGWRENDIQAYLADRTGAGLAAYTGT